MKIVAAAVAFSVTTAGCGLFTVKEPYERWMVTISYLEEGRRVTAEPTRIEVHGPRGEIRVNNSTESERGFKIDDLGIAAEIEDSSSRRITISGAQDGETYPFVDHLNRGGPRGVIVVDYIRQD